MANKPDDWPYGDYGWQIVSAPENPLIKFYQYWSTQDFETTFNQSIIPLALDQVGIYDLDHRLPMLVPSSQAIYVPSIYRDMYHDMKRFSRRKPNKGVVITGQPGIGKTTFLWFFLICCITQRSPVILHSVSTFFFYEGKVYEPISYGKILYTPKVPKQIYTLIDTDETPNPPPSQILRLSKSFLIHATSPQNSRYKQWIKERSAFVWGLPFWSLKDFCEGIALHPDYCPFRDALIEAFKGFEPVDGINPKALNFAVKFHRELQDADGDITMLEEPNQTSSPSQQVQNTPSSRLLEEEDAQNLIRDLVVHFMHKYGKVPRDVYGAVFETDSSLAQAVDGTIQDDNFTLASFMGTIKATFRDSSSPKDLAQPSHQLFLVEPIYPFHSENDRFSISFKSTIIARKVINRLHLLRGQHAQELFATLEIVPQARLLGDGVFEQLAHEYLAHVDTHNMVPVELCAMVNTGGNHFTVQSSNPLDATTTLSLSARTSYKVDFRQGSIIWPPIEFTGSVQQGYYIPSTLNNPLWDSIFVSLDTNSVARIWVFQMTLNHTHGGSAKGYPRIRYICELLHSTFSIQKSNIKVNYCLVVPHSVEGYEWRMPSEGRIPGDVFCLALTSSIKSDMFKILHSIH